ncbi:MAG: glycosyltransferase family 2 protein [Planctomycetes bacterium]|nr:glycosyltransferase family 2 protein [Planctomycetota bacterium]
MDDSLALESVFWASAGALAWSYAGYPAAMALVARLRPRPPRAGPPGGRLPGLSLVIPCHDEGDVLAAKLEDSLALDYPADLLEVVVSSDGSTDDTCRVARSHAARGVRLVEHPVRRGKAAAIHDAVCASRHEVVVLTDVRERLRGDALRHLAAAFADPEVGAVTGRVELGRGAPGATASGTAVYRRYEDALRRSESAAGSTLGFLGPIGAVRRSAYRPCPPGTILDDDALPLAIALGGARVVYEPRAVALEEPLATPGQELARRVRYQAGYWQLFARWPSLLNPLGGMLAFQFFSHRVLRALEPWLRAAALASALVLAERPLYAALAAAQAASYAAGVAGWLAWRLGGGRPPAWLALPLLVLLQNVAGVLGPWAWVRGRQTALWSKARPA